MTHLFFFNDTATTEIYPLSLHDALPISSAALGSASSETLSARLHAATKARLPSSARTFSKASARVPESTTVAPCTCSAFAMAPPMPPDAPVTSATFPERSNIAIPLPPPRGEVEKIRAQQRSFSGGGKRRRKSAVCTPLPPLEKSLRDLSTSPQGGGENKRRHSVLANASISAGVSVVSPCRSPCAGLAPSARTLLRPDLTR